MQYLISTDKKRNTYIVIEFLKTKLKCSGFRNTIPELNLALDISEEFDTYTNIDEYIEYLDNSDYSPTILYSAKNITIKKLQNAMPELLI